MSLHLAIEIFATLTGLLYLVLEIRQKNAMWWVGIATGAACAWMFFEKGLWASTGLNIYYTVISFWGLWQWSRDKRAMEASSEAGAGRIHLRRPSPAVLLSSAALLVAGSAGLIVLLRFLGDPESALDAVVTVLSAIATWWLARSYRAQWLLWIAADILSTVLCLTQGLYAMGALYLAYIAAAIYGWFWWGRQGVPLEDQ